MTENRFRKLGGGGRRHFVRRPSRPAQGLRMRPPPSGIHAGFAAARRMH